VTDRLVETRGARPGQGHPLGDTPLLIGRGSDCQVVVASEHASRHHAEVRRRDDEWLVRDLGSKNGTTVNGARIEGEVALHEGDEIEVPGGAWVYRRADETLTLHLPARARISVDAKRAEVRVDGRPVAVTARELLALAALAEDPGMLVTKDDLAKKVWPESDGVVSDDSIEQLVSRLRRKLGDDAREPRYLLTVRGLGYRLFASPDATK
jgi:hypothetical protein